MRKCLMLSLVLLFAILLAAVVYAASGYSFLCLNKDCGYKTNVSFGGGFVFDQITGYCVQCSQFVYLRWHRKGAPEVADNLPADPPTPVARIWNPSTGETISLYACPKCAKPFLPIEDETRLTHCPRCGKDKIEKDGRLAYD